MAELAQYHSDWNNYIINSVLSDGTVLNAAVNMDRKTTIYEIINSIKYFHEKLNQRILDSTEIRRGDLWRELDNYISKERTPPLEHQLYDAVIQSDEYKKLLVEKESSSEQEAPESGGASPTAEPTPQRYSQLGNTLLTDTLSTSSITLDEVDAILRDGGNDKNSVLRISAHFSKGLSPEENADFLRREYLLGRWGRSAKEGRGKGFQFGAEPTSVWSDDTGMTIGRGKSALAARDFAHITWEQATARVEQLYNAGQYVSHDVLDEALYNESAERADDFIEVYSNIQRGLSDIQYELRKNMDKEQNEATKDDWKHRRYLITGLKALSDRTDELLNGENEASPDEIMQLYNETLRISEEIPEEWGFSHGHPDMVQRITELLRDKGELSASEIKQGSGYSELSEFGIILRRLKEDIAELQNEPDAPIHFYRNPHRLLSNLEKAGLPSKGFPVAEIPTLSFMRFITEDEVDSYLTRGSHFSEGKCRIFSHFLHEHTAKERADFLKNEYGHGGGSWSAADDGWYDAEPGKGISLKRGKIGSPYSEVKLTWSAAATRIGKLVQDGRYMTRAELDRIPNYEKLMLMRSVSNFYYDLPAEYERPFVEKGSFSYLSKLSGEDREAMDFYYPREAEWAFIHSFLSDKERIDAVLGVMQYIYANTPEEDRYYNLRKAGFENLSAYREGTYTLFPGLDRLPDPALVETHDRHTAPPLSPRSEPAEQMTLFGTDVFPVLPSVHEQQTIIKQAAEPTPEPTAVVDTPAVSLSNELDMVDALLLNISDADKVRLAAQIADNPRSRETVTLVREIYGDTLPIPLPQAIKRIAELAGDGQFTVAERNEKAPDKNADWLDYVLVGKLVANTLKDRVYKYYTEENPSVPETAAFMENAYGKMFASGGLDEIGIRNFESKEDGITANLTDGGTRFADWTEIAVRVRSLIDAGEYLKSPDELIAARNSAAQMKTAETAMPDTETAGEADSTEKSSPTYYSPRKHISYREGDAVEGMIPQSLRFFVITKIDDAYVYCNFLHSTQKPLATRRNVFDIYLDDGQIFITEPDTGRTSDNTIESNALPKVKVERLYKVGDTVYLEDKTPYEITGINESTGYVQLKNTESLSPSFRTESRPQFEWLLTIHEGNEQFLPPLEEIQSDVPTAEEAPAAVPVEPTPLDFDAVAQTILARVMVDTEFAAALSEAQGRGALRRPLNTALEIAVYEHQEDEPQVYQAYVNDDDFNDRLFDFVYRQAWENRQKQEAAIAEQATAEAPPTEVSLSDLIRQELSERGFVVSDELIETGIMEYNAHGGKGNSEDIADFIENEFLTEDEPELGQEKTEKPNAEKLISADRTDYYLFHFPEATETPAALSDETLSLIKQRAYAYVICADVCYLSEEYMAQNNITFRKMPRDWNLLPEAVQDKIRAIRPDYEQQWLESTQHERDFAKWQEEQQTQNTPPLQITAPPVFFLDWEQAKHDFDLNLYNDGDIIGYDKNGVEQRLGRSGSLTYVTQTGAFWGSNSVPGDIYEQIQAYENGDVTDEQVRENYLKTLENFKNYRAADLVNQDFGDLADVLSNGLFSGEGKKNILWQLNNNATNYELSVHLLERWHIAPDTMTLESGETADYYSNVNGVFIDIQDRYNTKLSYTWAQVAPVLRALAQQWRAEQTAEHSEPSAQEQPRFTVKPIENIADVLSNHPAFDRISENDRLYGVWDTVSGDWVRGGDGHISFNSELGAGADADQLNSESAEAFIPALPLPAVDTHSEPTPRPFTAATNFRITDDHLGEGGAKTKYRYNIDAIKTLQAIEREKRPATPEEQQILSRYVGWGGLPDAFDAEKPAWVNEYRELQSLLTPEEYESARASTLNAHYTSPTVIRAIYDTVERMGFTTGNILEPACGVGNFFGLLPDSMKNAKMYGVELDSVTARIAKLLYPKANIKETGFERTDTPDAFFDLAIGNVPFGDYGVLDKRYDKHRFKIHDYFFAKTLDQVRPGGIIAFVTSKGTLDKQNPEVRKYIAQRAELLGAVRLPNTAFLKNAGTEVTSDIIFLKKRDRLIDIEPDWVHLGLTENGIPVNRYFVDNPEMILGTMANDDGVRMYGNSNSTTCIPIEGADLAEQLKTALFNVQGEISAPELDDIEGIDNHAIPADTNVKNFSYALITPSTVPDIDDGKIYAAKIGVGQVYFRENSLMYPVDLPATTLERIKGMIALRDCVHRLIALQLDDHSADEIAEQQQELDSLYDQFTAQYGLINSTANNRAFCADSAYYLLCSLEMLDEDGNLARKADMFTKRTIKQRTVITHVDTASEALAVSLGERACVDIEFMAELTGFAPEKLIQDLEGVLFFDFGNPNRSLPNFDPDKMKLYEKYPLATADEYLSGNVRDKLQKARTFVELMGDEIQGYDTTVNVAALEAAQPKDLEASEIAVRLGATWIGPEYVQQFMYELLNTNWRNRDTYQVKYHSLTGEWQVTGKGRAQYSDIHATVTYGTTRMNAYEIIADTLNLRDVRVYDYKEDVDGREVRVLNKKETTLAQQKQEQIKQAFKDWIWKDPERRQTLVALYNERFNSVRPREYDGSHITFSGTSPEITMRPHQLNAIAHILYGGNTLLAHVVGAGKTFEMVGAAMEAKRLGLCHKSLFAVPNHLTEQWAGEFLRLYPSANILVATKKDFELRNRKKFCAKIATGDYDAVIIGHSQMEKIPMSAERQERLLNEQIWEIEAGIAELKASNGERFSIKQLEKTKKSIEIRLKKLLESKKRDDVVTFEQLGVDRLFVDEAHSFKNLFLVTKMRNVAGLSTSEAQKSSDLFMKCRYMDELTDGKGIIFATGTPMYTLQQ